MTEPIPPPGPQPIQPQKPSSSNEQEALGVWQTFLSQGGTPATKEQTQLFINGILKFFTTLVAQERKKLSEANKHLRDVIEGKE
ncbi:MAG: hypothetical protein C5B45_03570 [Chlamydiae bacterium]|nr:MAG: hypothetical protein C5B45_03570 [Chlamydiota bacterium]